MEKTIKPRYQRMIIQYLGQSISFAILVWAILTMAGCSKRYQDVPAFMPLNLGNPHNYGTGTFKTAYIADQIDYYYRGTSSGPIGITTIVDLNDLYATSAFGRMFAEQLISELVMRGYDIVELRQGDALRFLSDAGEFTLSRDTGAVKRSYDLSAVLAGTYVSSPEKVYVNVRLIDPATSMILSSGSVEIGKTYEIAKMLRSGSFPMNLERVAVKHLASQEYPLTVFQTKYVTGGYDSEDSGYSGRPTQVKPKLIDKWDLSKGSKSHGASKDSDIESNLK